MSELTPWELENPYLVERGINRSCWSALCNTLYPSNKPEAIILAWEYCQSRELDIMMKPVHLVGMSVLNPVTNKKEFRDVVMPGIGLYRIQADRSGNYAGADEPEFGPAITESFPNAYNPNEMIEVIYPEWCKYTVHKIVGDRIVSFSAKEYWKENYATQKSGSTCPNAMWQKRPNGQLAKCAEAQALRKAWPEIGSVPTAEEMEGKEYFLGNEKDITPQQSSEPKNNDLLIQMITQGIKQIEIGNKTPQQIIGFITKKGFTLSPKQEATLNNVKVAA